MDIKLKQEQREQPRFPCVGIELLYSPLDHSVIQGVGESLIQASPHDISLAGIAFDVNKPLENDQELLVKVKSPDNGEETMQTRVRWCKPLDRQQYRVGVSIISIEVKTKQKSAGYAIDPIGHGVAVPSGVSFICPACNERSWFVLVGQQEGVPEPSLLPLYNCGLCHTTRSIPSLLSHNREKITEE